MLQAKGNGDLDWSQPGTRALAYDLVLRLEGLNQHLTNNGSEIADIDAQWDSESPTLTFFTPSMK